MSSSSANFPIDSESFIKKFEATTLDWSSNAYNDEGAKFENDDTLGVARLDVALAFYKKSLEIDKNSYFSHINMADVLRKKFEFNHNKTDLDQAIALYVAGIKVFDNAQFNYKFLLNWAYCNLGHAYELAGKTLQAVEVFEKVLPIGSHPNYWKAKEYYNEAQERLAKIRPRESAALSSPQAALLPQVLTLSTPPLHRGPIASSKPSVSHGSSPASVAARLGSVSDTTSNALAASSMAPTKSVAQALTPTSMKPIPATRMPIIPESEITSTGTIDGSLSTKIAPLKNQLAGYKFNYTGDKEGDPRIEVSLDAAAAEIDFTIRPENIKTTRSDAATFRAMLESYIITFGKPPAPLPSPVIVASEKKKETWETVLREFAYANKITDYNLITPQQKKQMDQAKRGSTQMRRR